LTARKQLGVRAEGEELALPRQQESKLSALQYVRHPQILSGGQGDIDVTQDCMFHYMWDDCREGDEHGVRIASLIPKPD
jgi:hypothetical protein